MVRGYESLLHTARGRAGGERKRVPPAAGMVAVGGGSAQAATGGAAVAVMVLDRSLPDHQAARQQAGGPTRLATKRADRLRERGGADDRQSVASNDSAAIGHTKVAQALAAGCSAGMRAAPLNLAPPSAPGTHRDTMQRRASLLLSLARAWSGGTAASGLGSLAALPAPCSSSTAASPVLAALQAAGRRWLTAGPVAQAAEREFITLNALADNPGATHAVRGSAPGAPRQGLAAGAAAAAATGGTRELQCCCWKAVCIAQCLQTIHGSVAVCSPSGWAAASARG